MVRFIWLIVMLVGTVIAQPESSFEENDDNDAIVRYVNRLLLLFIISEVFINSTMLIFSHTEFHCPECL